MPKILGYLPLNRSERAVVDRLKMQAPENWILIPNVTWSRRAGTGLRQYVRDGQADLVVLIPEMGMVVVEVKGSREFHVSDDGRWYRKDQKSGADVLLDESPVEQAVRNTHALADVVASELGLTAFPGLFGFLVVYPHGSLGSPLPKLFDRSTLAVNGDLSQLASKVRAALDERGTDGRARSFSEALAHRSAKALTAQPMRIVRADTEEDRRGDVDQLELLTRQQFATLRGLFEYPRVAVVGPAGSGKTILATWLMQALIEQSRRVLYTCFNKTLAESLRMRLPECAASVTSIDQYFLGLSGLSQREVQAKIYDLGAETFFGRELPSMVFDRAAANQLAHHLDAVIVDEGQDFTEEQLMALLEVVGESGSYFVFADQRQNLYRKEPARPVGAEIVFSLFHNCRNTARTNSAANALTSGLVASMPGAPDGVAPTVRLGRSALSRANEAWGLAKAWSESGRVAILSPYTLPKSSMAGAPSGHSLKLVTNLADWHSGTVFFSTIRSFKGLEAEAVILTDVSLPAAGSPFTEEDLYVALTRPTGRLAILCSGEAAHDWVIDSLAKLVR